MEPEGRRGDEPSAVRTPVGQVLLYAMWPGVLVAVLGLLALGAGGGVAQLEAHCAQRNCGAILGPLSVVVDVLKAAGLTEARATAVFGVTLILLPTLASLGAAGLVYWRHERTLVAASALYFLTLFGSAWTGALSLQQPANALVSTALLVVTALSIATLAAYLFLSPDGEFDPPWARRVLVFGLQLSPILIVVIVANEARRPILGYLVLGVLATGLYAQLRKYAAAPASASKGAFARSLALTVVVALVVVFDRWIGVLFGTEPVTATTWLERSAVFVLMQFLVPISVGASQISPQALQTVRRFVQWPLFAIALVLLVVQIFVPAVSDVVTRLGFTGVQQPLVIVLASLTLFALANALRRPATTLFVRVFLPDRIDFRDTFVSFTRQLRTVVDLDELVRFLVARTTELLHVERGAVYIQTQEGAFRAEAWLNAEDPESFRLEPCLDRLESGELVRLDGGAPFAVLVPLTAPDTTEGGHDPTRLIGVLALGPRLGLRLYADDTLKLLQLMSEQAGTAIRVATFVERQRQEDEQRVRHEASPLGLAEQVAARLSMTDDAAAMELLDIARTAGDDPSIVAMFGHLPSVVSERQGPAAFADGCRLVLGSRDATERLRVGLHEVVTHLQSSAAEVPDDPRRQIAVHAYQRLETALNAGFLPAITDMGGVLDRPLNVSIGDLGDAFDGLERVLAQLCGAVRTLHAAERVDHPQDKITYLATALEELTTLAGDAYQTVGNLFDEAIVQGIVRAWQSIVAMSITDLQAKAQLRAELVTRRVLADETVSLLVMVSNDGSGPATNVNISLEPTAAYTPLAGTVRIGRIAPGEQVQASIGVRLLSLETSERIRTRFRIEFDDPRAAQQVEYFADVVYVDKEPAEFQFIPNPYVIGTALQAGSPVFFGREDVFQFVTDNLNAAHRNNLVLTGQRRTGKSSLLKQLPLRLPEAIVAVYIDGQSISLDPGPSNMLATLAQQIVFALEDRGFAPDHVRPADFTSNAAMVFEHEFLPRIRATITQRHLLILLDEFEELEAAANRGAIDITFFRFLRHLLQHARGLSIIFCGTHRMEQLNPAYWNEIFNMSLVKQIGFLDRPEAMRLVEEPVAPYNMQYDDNALAKLWRITAGHPYLLQLLCHALVNRHNLKQRSYITENDVNIALDEVLVTGEAHFIYLWTQSDALERVLLVALSRPDLHRGRTSAVHLTDFLAGHHALQLNRRAISNGLHGLTLRDILDSNNQDDGPPTYRWKLDLFRRWIAKTKSFSRVVEELHD